MNKELSKARKYLIEKNYNLDELFTALFKELVPKMKPKSIPEAIVVINEHQTYAATAIPDKELNTTALLVKLMRLV